LSVFRVNRDLLAVIFGAAAALATRVAAHRLSRLVFRWLEDPLTDAASPFAFRRLTGVTRVVVLDNLREGVLSPDVYDPTLNPLYRDVLRHYGAVALP